MSECKLPPIGEFKPCVYYNKGLDCLEVHLVDASSTEHQLNEGIIVGSDHSNPKEIHSVQVNNPGQHLPQVTALKAQVKELKEKLSLYETKIKPEDGVIGRNYLIHQKYTDGGDEINSGRCHAGNSVEPRSFVLHSGEHCMFKTVAGIYEHSLFTPPSTQEGGKE